MKLRMLMLTCLGAFTLSKSTHGQQGFPTKASQKIASIKPMTDAVKAMAEQLVQKGFTAGNGYGEVWIRDLNTFVTVSGKMNDKELLKKHLIKFLHFQQPDGGILDGYIPIKNGAVPYNYYHSALEPDYAGHKNTVETDQESSLVQAIAKYVRVTGDKTILSHTVSGVSVQKHLERSMEFLLNERFDKKHGLLWGATTADWGDVQPEHSWGVVIDSNSHMSIDVYDNAMFIVALNDFLEIADLTPKAKKYWMGVKNKIATNTRKHLWDKKNQKFIPHIYLNGSPFPASFNESEIYYHGGTAIAIEAGLLSKEEVKTAYRKMQENVKKANAATIGLTLYPVYPQGFFKNPVMVPHSYQNGGDWTWFGGRMVSQLIRYDLLEEACEAITPMLERVIKNKDFYEWYTPDNKPRGASNFRGSAGVLWSAITELEQKNK